MFKTIFKVAVVLVAIFVLGFGCSKEDAKPIMPLSVITTSATLITESSATAGGNIVYDGGNPVLERGVCWSTAINPTLDNSITTDGEGTGIFTSLVTGLTANTTYYVRAYIINNEGVFYGNELSFETSKPLTITTAVASMVTEVSATIGGNVIHDGGNAVLERGVCWNTTINPTVDNSTTIDGEGAGIFTSSLTGLTPGTTYYARAYVVNIEGTFYGDEVSFKTSKKFAGNVVLQTQEEVNEFGSQGYTVVTGSVTIGNSTTASASITSLEPLHNLQSIGYLMIHKNEALVNLDGLDQITEIKGGFCEIEDNSALKNIDGLVNLTSLFTLDIVNNDALENVDGLSSLSSILRVTISDNDALINIDGLSNISLIKTGLKITNNDALTNVNGLSNITSIKYSLYIYGNDALTNINGLNNVSSVTEDLVIGGNNALINLDGLSKLTFTGRNLIITYNPSLISIEGLSKLNSIGGYLNIENNNALISLDGLNNLSKVESHIAIHDNDELVDLCALQTLASTGFRGESISGNAFNPTLDSIQAGNCSQ